MARANHEGDASERRALPEPDTINQNQESNGKDSMGTTIAQEHQQSRPRNLNPFAWTCVVVSLLFSMFLFSLDNVIVADIQPSIISTLGNVDKLPWVSVGYALGATAVNLLVARLFSLFNNKYIFIAGVLVFEIGSAICGAAPNMTALIFGRVICGIGSPGIYVGNMNLLSVLTTEAERPLYLSFVGLTWGLGTVLGPVIGGAFADGAATWRWAFYFNLCIGAVVAPVYLLLLPSVNPRRGDGVAARLREVDWFGALLFAGAYACLVMGVSFGGGVYDWKSGPIIALFVVSGVLWAAFAIQQSYSLLILPENRLVPFDVLKSWEMQIFFVQIAAAVTVVYVPMYFIPIYFQFVQADSALNAAVYLLPFVFMNVFGIVLNGAVMGKIGYYMPWYLVGGMLCTIGGALFTSTITVSTSPSAIYGYSVLCGLGSGLYVQASFAVAQAKVKSPGAIPLTVAFLGCGQITGITLALTVSNAIYLNGATNRIAQVLPAVQRATVQQAITGVNGMFLNTIDPASRGRVLEAIVDTINHVYIMVIIAGVVSTLLSFLMRRERLYLQPQAPTDGEEKKEVSLE